MSKHDQTTATRPERLITIELLRALAAFFVVGFHATVLWHDRRPLDAVVPWVNGNSGVDLFFVISGCVMVLSSQSLRSRGDGWRVFATRRIARIVPLYWLMTAAKLAAITTVPSLALHSRPTTLNVIASFLFLPSRDATGVIVPVLPVGWTLIFEMLFYALFTLALWLRCSPIAAVGPALLLLAGANLLRTEGWGTVGFFANPMVLEFLLGMIIADLYLKSRRRFVAGPAMGLVGLAGLICLGGVDMGDSWQRALVWGGGGAALVAAALAFESTIADRVPRILVCLGEASYSLYLTHGYVLPVIGVVVAMSGVAGRWFGIILVASCLLSSGVAALLSYRLVEKPIGACARRLPLFTGPCQRRPVSPVATQAAETAWYPVPGGPDGIVGNHVQHSDHPV